MALKKKFSYQIRLFIPMVILLWIAIIGLVCVQYYRERAFKQAVVVSDINLINNRIIDMHNRNLNISHFLDFIDIYYSSSVIRDLSVSLYDGKTHEYIDGKGIPVPLPENLNIKEEALSGNEINRLFKTDSLAVSKDMSYYFRTEYSPDSMLIVLTMLPYNEAVVKATSVDNYVWLVIMVVLIFVSLIAYLSTRHMTKNLLILRDFARRAAEDRNFVTYEVFPDDELGDISRQIVEIYNTRNMAVLSREHEHNIAISAIEERERLKRQLTNNISHELKTPVGIIKGYIDTIIESPDMDEAARRHFITKAQAQVNRLCDLLNDLSSITRLEDAGASITTEKVNFHELVDSLANEIQESGISNGMTFSWDVPENCFVNINKNLVTAAMLNLVKNAAAYSKGTEIGLKCIGLSNNFYSFIFYDNGVGVAEEHLNHLFERFFRIDSGRSRKTGGTGLGLPIVKSTINLFGGAITVTNREEGGLQFTFTLPCWQDTDEPRKE